jgi:hypothetical protein
VSPDEQEMIEIAKLLTSAGELMPSIKKTIMRGTQPDLDRELLLLDSRLAADLNPSR